MLYGVYYCNRYQRYLIVEEKTCDFCFCGNADIHYKRLIYGNQIEKTIEELKQQGKKVL